MVELMFLKQFILIGQAHQRSPLFVIIDQVFKS